MSEKKSFWTTLPGILTGVAGIITATAGLIGILYQIGVIGPRIEPEPEPGTRKEISSERESDGESAGFRVVEARLRADPFDHTGPCPVEISFSGRISVAGGAGTVSYKFLRSDGASAPVQTINFDEPGSKKVSATWRLGAATPRFNPYKGWQAIKIFDPREMESNKAHFTIRCR